MGREYTYTWEVTEHQPPRWMTIGSTSGPLPTTHSLMRSGQEAATRLQFTVTGRPTGRGPHFDATKNRSRTWCQRGCGKGIGKRNYRTA
jgi:hypothetical protein